MIKKILLLVLVSFTKYGTSQCSVQIAINNLDCVDENNNSLIANVIGQAPYHYSWSNSDTTSVADSINFNASMTVTITDDTGCVASDTEISISSPICCASFSINNTSCLTCCDGSINFTPSNSSTLCNITDYTWILGFDIFTTAMPMSNNLCAGTYTVITNTDCMCNNASVYNVNSNSTNLSEVINNPQLQIYPNPASSLLNVELPLIINSFDNNSFVTVYNTLGEIALKQNINEQNFNLDVSEFEKGIYLVAIIDHNIIQFSKKFIKE
ncbi:MAG: T9SS type A sorting domain-containing protein [Bacteroidetes bacterium]|nr:T9SS type A sorting domain-containing protein [Bacteroidota bacterium]